MISITNPVSGLGSTGQASFGASAQGAARRAQVLQTTSSYYYNQAAQYDALARQYQAYDPRIAAQYSALANRALADSNYFDQLAQQTYASTASNPNHANLAPFIEPSGGEKQKTGLLGSLWKGAKTLAWIGGAAALAYTAYNAMFGTPADASATDEADVKPAKSGKSGKKKAPKKAPKKRKKP